MRNVRERMAVLYGDLATVDIISRPGRGTKVTLLMPIVDPGAEPWPLSSQAVIAAAEHLVEDVMRVVKGNR